MGDAGDGCGVGLRAWSGINFSIGVEGFGRGVRIMTSSKA